MWPFVPFWIAKVNGQAAGSRVRLFLIRLDVLLAVHYSFDLFPQAWQGYALSHVPFYGPTESLFLWLWLVLSHIAISLSAIL